MKIITFALMITLLLISNTAAAQMQGPMYQVNVRGLPMNCRSHTGQPVAIYFNYQLNNIGIASHSIRGQPVIVLNPAVIQNFSNTVAQWWFAHECAHHALHPRLNTEVNADCFAIRQLVQFGILNHPQQFNAFYREISSLPGSATGHLPGRQRFQLLLRCATH